MTNNSRLLGISIYPAHQEEKEMRNYIDLAHKYGFKRIFASMLELDEETKDKLLNKFSDTFLYAKKKGFDICLDVNPRIFDLIGAKPADLSIFDKLNVTTVRLDMPMDGRSEAEMTFNPYNLKIEINISNNNAYLENIISYKPLKDNLIGCHNFYPQKNTGLEYNFFVKSTQMAKAQGIRTCAFVSSKNGKQGPWSVSDGLPTLEMHRNLAISTQAKHLWATGLVDDIIIGNAFASEEELKALSALDRYRVTLSVIALEKTSDIEKKIILLNSHFRRGDLNEYSIRSTMSRVWYKKENFSEHDNKKDQQRGDIFIGNNSFGIYKGELQLILKSMKNDERKNLVARVTKNDLFLLDYIKSWDKFKFIIEECNG